MLKTALAGVIAVLLSGCVVVTGNSLALTDPDRSLEEVVIQGEGDYKVALLNVSGVLTDSPSSAALGLVQRESTLARVDAALRKAAADPDVRALLLRIDSPGGSVSASDSIYARIQRFQAERDMPVIALLGGFATSGGYYIACSAERIVATPATITGSIGVILVHINVEGLLDKLGIDSRIYQAGEHKDLLSPLSRPTPEERAMVQTILDDLHHRFIQVVRTNRPSLDSSRIDTITSGRVFDARQALDAGLVDRIGYLPDALRVAEARAGIDDTTLVRYVRPGETRDSAYARAAGVEPRMSGPIPGGPSSQFMYLWPGAM